MVLFLGIGPPFVNPGVCPSGQHLDSQKEGGIVTVVSVHPAWRRTSPLGDVPVGLGTALATVTTSPIFQECVFLFPLFFFFEENTLLFFSG